MKLELGCVTELGWDGDGLDGRLIHDINTPSTISTVKTTQTRTIVVKARVVRRRRGTLKQHDHIVGVLVVVLETFLDEIRIKLGSIPVLDFELGEGNIKVGQR